MTTTRSRATAKALATAVEQREALGAALDLAIAAMFQQGLLNPAALAFYAADGKTVMLHCLEARLKGGRAGPLPVVGPRSEP